MDTDLTRQLPVALGVVAVSLAAGAAVASGKTALLLGGALALAFVAWIATHRRAAATKGLPVLLLLPQFIPGVPFSIVAWGVLLIAAVDRVWRRTPSLPASVWVSLTAFLAYALGTMLFGSSQPAMTGMVLVLFTLPLILIVGNVNSPERVDELLDGIIYVASVLALVAIAERLRGQYLVPDSLAPHLARSRFGQLRAQATLPHPIALGLILANAFVLALGRLIAGRRSAVIPLALLATAILFTYSRAPLLLILAAAVTMAGVLVGSRGTRRLSVVLAVTALTILATPLRHDVAALANSLRNEASTTEAGAAIQSRALINDAIGEFVQQHPGGVGFFGLADRTIPAYGASGSFNAARSVDNTYLLAFAELGWVGGALLAMLLLANSCRAIWAARKWRRQSALGPILASVAGAQVGFVIAAFTVATVTTWGQVSLAYWLTVGLGIATERVAGNMAVHPHVSDVATAN